jgi:coniferyl-aldehyde dehydrogenase
MSAGGGFDVTTVEERLDTAAHGDLRAILDRQRQAFIAEGPPSVEVRRHRIDRLLALALDNIDAFVDAMAADFGTRSRAATVFMEVVGIVSLIEHTRSHVADWMRPKRLMRGARHFGLKADVESAPLGVVGIIGPWNAPLNLVVLPAASAFAAGNRVMIKCSEIAPRTAEVLARVAPEYFEPDELQVVTGGPDVAAEFAGLPFDHLFFTGSPSVGALVARTASANLVPVTLELGGKNPVVVAPDADLRRSASRIAKARMVNGGQVCICPDYVLVPEGGAETFADVARDTWQQMFPAIVANGEYGSLVNEANYDRVVGLIEDARAKGAQVDAIAPIGEVLPDRATRKIAPTIVRGVDDTMNIASDEIFGPVLVVMEYAKLADAIAYINGRPSPLVAYWYGPDGGPFREFVRRTRSGGVARNDFGAQMIPSEAPFGGVGRSGMGSYHGKAGFDTFSHQRSVVGTDLPFSVTGSAAPPFTRPIKFYGDFTLRMARRRTNKRLAAHDAGHR